ncbi:hypothetical protein [Verrucomicrobium spinosum]|uniref:hypothetical protein n=1 Tax=Verrucomicrobium spinosum TaxID=2736 RepID=UPI000174556A|nr:hypothetical protein [Verrucomicrobium spinosum]
MSLTITEPHQTKAKDKDKDKAHARAKARARAKAKTPTLDPEIRRDITAEIVNSPAHHRALRRSNAAWFDQVWYDTYRKEYLVLNHNGDWFPVQDGTLRRHCKVRGMLTASAKHEVASEFEEYATMVQSHRPVGYAGPLAGHCKGLRRVNGQMILVTTDPCLPQPMPGPWPVMHALIEGLFASPEHDQRVYLYGWLQCAIQALHAHWRKAGQVLVMAGPVKSGKSLFQKVITQLLGGRECRPYGYMTGATDFNADMFGCEHLRLDDENGNTDIKARRQFGARIKELLYGHEQRLHGKHKDALLLDPVWRMSVALNEEPENMQVLPPLDDSLEDKLMILRAARCPMPMPTGSLEEESAFWSTLMNELPHFTHFLLHEFEIPAALRDSRSGIRHWHHPELLQSIRELSSEVRFLALVDRALLTLHLQECWEGTANDLEAQLLAIPDVRSEAQRILYFPNACGTFLGRLARLCPDRVQHQNTRAQRGWKVLPPESHRP